MKNFKILIFTLLSLLSIVKIYGQDNNYYKESDINYLHFPSFETHITKENLDTYALYSSSEYMPEISIEYESKVIKEITRIEMGVCFYVDNRHHNDGVTKYLETAFLSNNGGLFEVYHFGFYIKSKIKDISYTYDKEIEKLTLNYTFSDGTKKQLQFDITIGQSGLCLIEKIKK